MDPESVIRDALVNKKNHWRDIKKAVENCEVILYVLDARDPMESINTELDELIDSNSKKILYILNKVDLIPEENAKAWRVQFKKDGKLLIPFQANLSLLNKSVDKEDIQTENGSSKLLKLLFKYSQKFAEKKKTEFISVGVVGFPNVGKSSLVNILRNKPVCATGSNPFLTKKIQEVKINSLVLAVDTPSLILTGLSKGLSLQAVRSATQVEEIKDPISMIEQIT